MPRTATTDGIQLRTIGESIRSARHAAGLTQAEVGRRLGASGPYVSSFETGKSNMTVAQLAAIADAVGAELHIELRHRDLGAEPKIPVVARAA